MAKINPADEATSRHLNIQVKAAPNTRAADMLLVIICAAILAGFGISIWVLPHKAFSPDENRTLAQFPEFSINSLTGGRYTAAVGSFYADQFPFREYFVGLRRSLNWRSKMQNNTVIHCAGGNLVKRLEYQDYSNAKKNLAALTEFRDALAPLGIPVIPAFVPRPVDVLNSILPPLYGSDRSDRVWEVIAASQVGGVDLLTPTRSLAGQSEYVWYRTDHHWTTRGAYAAYIELARASGTLEALSF